MPTAPSHRRSRRRIPSASGGTLPHLIAGLVLSTLAILGCARTQAVVQAPVVPEITEVVATQPPTSEPTQAPSATPVPSDTPTPLPSATPTHTPTPPPTAEPLSARITLENPQIAQGHMGVVRVSASRPSSVAGHLADQDLHFVSTGEADYLALVGIHALASPERLPLTVEVVGEDGGRVGLETVVEVVAADYEHETIYFDAETTKLLDPAITEPENVLMGQVWATLTPRILWTEPFCWPVVGPTTSFFGTRRSYGGQVSSYHAGIDIDGETGDPVVAAADGVVVMVEPLQVRGNVVVIDHGAGVLTGYFHLDSFAVEDGQTVKAGDVIGAMGATGLVTGSHLHWELHVGGVATSPAEWVESAPLP